MDENLELVKDCLHKKYPSSKIKPLKESHHNINFILSTKSEKFVVRTPAILNKSNIQTLKREYSVLRLINGKFAPQPIKFQTINHIPFIIMEYVKGVHKEFSKLSTKEINMLAKSLSQIHKIKKREYTVPKGPKSGTHLDYLKMDVKNAITVHLSKLPNNSTVNDSIDLLKKSINKPYFSRKTFSLIHGDLNPNNVFWGKKVSFIDWEDGRFGDPADDVAYINAINNLSDKFMTIFVKEYMNYSNDIHLPERLKIYELKNRIFDVVWAMRKLKEEEKGKSLIRKKKGLYQRFYETRMKNLKKFLAKY